jgi:hypothetical protein
VGPRAVLDAVVFREKFPAPARRGGEDKNSQPLPGLGVLLINVLQLIRTQ